MRQTVYCSIQSKEQIKHSDFETGINFLKRSHKDNIEIKFGKKVLLVLRKFCSQNLYMDTVYIIFHLFSGDQQIINEHFHTIT